MLDIIKALIEIARNLAGAGDKLRSEQFKGVGEKLLVLYFRINETIDSAQALLVRMQGYRRVTDWRRANGKEAIYTGSSHHFDIDDVLKDQSLNIGRLAQALEKTHVELSLVDGNLTRRLHGLLEGKSNAVAMLRVLLGSSQIPLRSITAKELNAAIEENLNRHGFFDYEDVIIGDGTEVIKERGGNEQLYQQISIYLDSGLPQKRIDELIALANEIREQIGKHWPISDILPKARRIIGEQQ